MVCACSREPDYITALFAFSQQPQLRGELSFFASLRVSSATLVRLQFLTRLGIVKIVQWWILVDLFGAGWLTVLRDR